MAFNAQIISVLALIWFLSNTCETKQFCQSFVDNNNEIGFVFRVVNFFDYESQSYLFIDDHYWYLDFDQDLTELSFWKTECKSPHQWFGRQYSLAMCLWRPFEGYCAIGLIDKSQTSIDFRKRILTDDHMFKKYVKVAKNPIQFTNHFRPTVAFVVNDGIHENLTWFFQQHRRSDNKFDLTTELYEFNNSLQPQLVDDYGLRDQVNPIAVRLIDSDLEIIGIYRQILRPSSVRTTEEYGIIILFKIGKVIKYCWTRDKTLSHSCKKENLNTLIDCNAYYKPLQNQFMFQTTEKSSSWVKSQTTDTIYSNYFNSPIMKAALIMIVFIFMLQIIIHYRGKGKNDDQYKMNLIFAEEFQKKTIKV